MFVYKEPPSKGLVGSEKDLTQTQDITPTSMKCNIAQLADQYVQPGGAGYIEEWRTSFPSTFLSSLFKCRHLFWCMFFQSFFEVSNNS